MRKHIDVLREKCQEWGGDLIRVPLPTLLPGEVEYDRRRRWRYKGHLIEEAPFCKKQPLGVIYSQKLICYSDRRPPWYEVLHEMGHVFASRSHPSKSKELSFLGWEYVMAQHLTEDLRKWFSWMGDYNVVTCRLFCESLGFLTKRDQLLVLNEAIAQGKRYGNIGKDGTPLSVRK